MGLGALGCVVMVNCTCFLDSNMIACAWVASSQCCALSQSQRAICQLELWCQNEMLTFCVFVFLSFAITVEVYLKGRGRWTQNMLWSGPRALGCPIRPKMHASPNSACTWRGSYLSCVVIPLKARIPGCQPRYLSLAAHLFGVCGPRAGIIYNFIVLYVILQSHMSFYGLIYNFIVLYLLF